MPAQKKQETWRVVLAVEPSLLMGFTSRNKVDNIGYADLLYNYLNYLFKESDEFRETNVIFKGIELVLWKGNGCLKYYSAENIRDTIHLTILSFAEECIGVKSKKERADFIKARDIPLCTGQALNLALKQLQQTDDNTKTLLFFMSDDPRVFSSECVEELSLSFIPDLTVFFLTEEAVVDGCPVIAGFCTEAQTPVIYDIISWSKDFKAMLQGNDMPASGRITSTIFNNALKKCIDKKSGICYALYGVIKDALGIVHSHANSL